MRKIVIMMLLTSFALVISGCGTKTTVNTMAPWETDDESAKQVVEIVTANEYSAFARYNVDSSFKSLKVGIDYYKKGKLEKSEDKWVSSLENEGSDTTEGVVGFVLQDGKLNIGKADGAGSGSAGDIELPGDATTLEEGLGFAPLSQESEIKDGEKLYLGNIADGDVINPEFVFDNEDMLKSSDNCWLVYVVFSKESMEDDAEDDEE